MTRKGGRIRITSDGTNTKVFLDDKDITDVTIEVMWRHRAGQPATADVTIRDLVAGLIAETDDGSAGS